MANLLTKNQEGLLRYLMQKYRAEHFKGESAPIGREHAFEFAQAVAAALYDLGLLDDEVARSYGLIMRAEQDSVDGENTLGTNI